jgi:hypothetical protein
MTKSSISEAMSFVKKETKELSNQAKKIDLQNQMEERLSYLKTLHQEDMKANSAKIERTQNQIAILNESIKKLWWSTESNTSKWLSISLSKISREFVNHFSAKVNQTDVYSQNLLSLAVQFAGGEYKNDFPSFKKLYYDTFGGQNILEFSDEEKGLYDVWDALIQLHDTQESLKNNEQSGVVAALKAEKKVAQSAYLINTVPKDNGLRFLFDLDGDNIIEMNQFVKDTGIDWKIAKKQQQKGDDSFIDLGDKKANKKNEKFAGYDVVSMVSAYHYVVKQGLSETQIVTNIKKSIKTNASSFNQYMSYRLIGRDNRNDILDMIDEMSTRTIDLKDKKHQKLIQVYMVDFLRQAGVEPSDVFAGVIEKIDYTKTDHKAEGSVKVDLATIQQAMQNSDKKDLYANLTEGQKRWLDIHIAWLWAYVQRNQMVVKNITPLENRDPKSDYSDTTTNNEFGSLSAAFVQTVLDRSGDKNHPFHIDFAAIPMVHASGLDGGTIQGDVYVWPNWAYTLVNGEKFRLVANGYAGYGLLSNSATAWWWLTASKQLSSKKLWATSKSIELGVWAGWNSLGWPFMTGFVGMDIDHVATVLDNARKLTNLFTPIVGVVGVVGGLEEAKIELKWDADDYALFKTYILDQHKSTIKKNQIKELYGSLVVAKELAGGIAELKKNPEWVFAELIKQVYQHNQQLDLRWLRYGGVNIDFVQLFLSPNFWGKLRALFGVLKLKNHRTAITQSGTYLQSTKVPLVSDEELNSKDMTPQSRAQTISTKLNQAYESIIGGTTTATDAKFKSNEKGEITIPKSALIVVNELPGDKASSDGTKVLKPEDWFDVVVYPDKIVISKVDPKTIQTTKIITSNTTSIGASTDMLTTTAINTNVATSSVSLESTFAALQSTITSAKEIEPIKTKDEVIDKYKKDRWAPAKWEPSYLQWIWVNNSTPEINLETIKSWVKNQESFRKNVTDNLPALHLWLLRHYNQGKGATTIPNLTQAQSDPAYQIYNRLIGIQTSTNGQFIEPRSNGELRITNRKHWIESHWSDFIKSLNNAANNWTKNTTYEWYADFNNWTSADVNTQNISGYSVAAVTYNFDHTNIKGQWSWTKLDYNRFMTKIDPTDSNIKWKSFKDIFAYTDIKEQKYVEAAKEALKKNKDWIDRIRKDQLDFISTIKTRIKEKLPSWWTVDLTELNKLEANLKANLEDPTASRLYETTNIELPIQDEKGIPIKDEKGTKNIVVDRKTNSGWYQFFNKQCLGNNVVAFVSKWSLTIPEVTITKDTTNKIGNATISHASEVVNVDTLVRWSVLGAGAGLQNGEYLNGTKPGGHIPNTDPTGIGSWANIDPNAPNNGWSTGWFNPNNTGSTNLTPPPTGSANQNGWSTGWFNPTNTTRGSGQEVILTGIAPQKADIHDGKNSAKASKKTQESKNDPLY